MSKILEIACFNLESVFIAQTSGADRIELCTNYPLGGITPSEELMLEVRNSAKIPVFVIIRPRGGNFVYSRQEIEEMKKSILFCKQHNMDGLVFGCLTKENKIDEHLCHELISLSNPLPVTFHRAIDTCLDPSEEIQKLVKHGFKRVLTSGGQNTAYEGKKNLRKLNSDHRNKITIMPGGGIRSENISEIMNESQCDEYHSAALINDSVVCDANEIKKMKTILNKAL